MKHLIAFLGGAVIGAAAAVLFAPQKGVESRARIKLMLKKYGIVAKDDELEELVDEISDELASIQKEK